MIYRLLRLLGFRSLWDQLREDQLLRVSLVGDHAEITYLGRRPLPQHHIRDIYRAASYWGLETLEPQPRERTAHERRMWVRTIRQLGKDAETNGRLEHLPAYNFRFPIVLGRANQRYPAAFDLLVRRIGSGLTLTLPELDQLTRNVVMESLRPEEAHRMASELR